ncbi:acyl-CoA acyltransferase [Formosa agariphila KMM 3901]|uniref:Acyl-CoA acyltransferase n=1 Tax=Formosa agariphila (strain DSM 15362 / KCTC 12365 / LMG 23005 / KMM 3901 / M-2Alg 35-1) TaxID=1347342 RepID=T2KJG2_FORAG|nr:N-acetyltransferase [Formosa agariphila]CDF78573.1 acyl-CoA acyltransferase [Formosa agariphila KMM 3901]
MTETAEVTDNDFLRQFEYKIDNDLAIIEYSLQERKIFLTKLIVSEAHDNEDFKNEFITLVLKNIQERNLSVMPTCPAIIKFMRKNKQYKSMLPIGVRI